MSDFSLMIDPATIAAANASMVRGLKIPEHANKKGQPEKPDGGQAYWTEAFTVVSSEMARDDKNPDQIVATVKFQVAADTESENAGQTLTQWYRLTPAAFGNKQHDKFKGTQFALGRMNALLAVAGFGVDPSEPVDYGEYFAGDAPAIVGAAFFGLVKHSWYEGKSRQDIVEFVTTQDGGA